MIRKQSAVRTTVLAILLSTVMSTMTAMAAYAYNNLDNECHWNNTTPLYVLYKYGANLQTPGTAWRNAFNAGISNWNTASIEPIFSYDASNSRNTVDTYSAADGNWGNTWWYCNVLYYLDRFDAKGNVYYSMNDQQREEVASHELGHGLGFGHSTVSPSVMNQYGPYGTWGVPQQDDINGANAMYP